jgi:hypothetical protein
MRIIFDLRRVGLGNNGGSSTIVNSANTLGDLGHEVFVVSSGQNLHTWTPLHAPHVRASDEKHIPDADFIIATGYKSVKSTVSAPDRCGKKLHWIRGWETWQMSEDDIVKKVLGAPTIKLVNSIGLKEKLTSYNCDSYIVRPGYDIDEYYPLGIREKNEKVILGALYNENRNGQAKRTGWIWETTFKLKSIRRDLELWLFGDHKRPSGFLFNKYVRRPSLKEKNEFYNNINIWLAPTGLEGLHMPPAEAMLTGCPVIGTNSKMNGMQEYLVHMNTGIVTENNLLSFIKDLRNFIDDKELQLELGKNAREKILEIGSRQENMKKMIQLLQRLKDENI